MQSHILKDFYVIDNDTFKKKMNLDIFANLSVIQPIPIKKKHCRVPAKSPYCSKILKTLEDLTVLGISELFCGPF